MPEDSKKNQRKGKNEPKEQRRPRRQPPTPTEKTGKKIEEPKIVTDSKASLPEKPVYEEPGPEFYKNLKRETEEILKITEEANAKYKKKEIQSNWSKYEMPIDSYEEIEEQENMGADYEKLIQAPLSTGGYFQFKHEKSWDISTGPTLYDKYFEVNMENLATALSTIPFYERNCIDKSIFNDTDIQNMINRSVKYKQKYYNDKTYTTPELDAQEKILNSLKENMKSESITEDHKFINTKNKEQTKDESVVKPIQESNNILDDDYFRKSHNNESLSNPENIIQKESKQINSILETNLFEDKAIDNIDDIILRNVENDKINEIEVKEFEPVLEKIELPKKIESPVPVRNIPEVTNTAVKETTKNPVIESPEDLEKWLDDFLDG